MKLYVGNLSKQITEDQLADLATPYGNLISANVATERSSGESKGFGFIEFTTEDEGKAAIRGLDGKEIYGHVLKVNPLQGTEDGDDR